MLQTITGKVGSWLGGFSSKASSAIGGLAGPAGRLGTSFSGDAMRYKGITALAKTVRFGASHPMMAGAAMGAIGGYATTGDIGGALVGAGIGAGVGRMGVTQYQTKAQGVGLLRQRASAKLGRGISKFAPNVSAAYGPTGKVGRARNVGGKRLGAMAVGAGITVGAGALGGMALNMASAGVRGMGNTFGSQMSQTYGNAFSGMGNGTVTGY